MHKVILAAFAATWAVAAAADPGAILICNARIFDGRVDASSAGPTRVGAI